MPIMCGYVLKLSRPYSGWVLIQGWKINNRINIVPLF